jgi:hypothetical protein
MMQDKCLADPVKFGHIRRELGIDADQGQVTSQQ